MKLLDVRAAFITAILLACAGLAHAVQNDCGRPDCNKPPPQPAPAPRVAPKPPRTSPRTTTRLPPRAKPGGRSGGGSSDNSDDARETDEPQPPCEAAEVLVRCGVPGCEVKVDGMLRGLTNDDGELLVEGIAHGTRKIAISKQGYEGDNRDFKFACNASETANLNLRIRPVKLRIRTNPPGAEVFVNDPPASVGRSSAEGTLDYVATTPALLVQARRPGYLSDSRRILVNPADAQREVVLTLKPIPAQLTVGVNITGARVRVDKESVRALTSEPLQLAPGDHRVEVDALGYAPATLELTTTPGETLKRTVALERLAPAELTAQAEAAFNQRAYETVLTLCGYVFETDASAPAAHRLAGITHVARQEYANAEPHLAQALAGGETIVLPVRRHARESYDPVKGHDACEGFLYFGKSEIEYRGKQVTTENFKVAYAQVQIIGVQLKKNVAVYLGTKVADARGKKQDFNFFSFDKEISQSGRSYLEMLQRLLKAH